MSLEPDLRESQVHPALDYAGPNPAKTKRDSDWRGTIFFAITQSAIIATLVFVLGQPWDYWINLLAYCAYVTVASASFAFAFVASRAPRGLVRLNLSAGTAAIATTICWWIASGLLIYLLDRFGLTHDLWTAIGAACIELFLISFCASVVTLRLGKRIFPPVGSRDYANQRAVTTVVILSASEGSFAQLTGPSLRMTGESEEERKNCNQTPPADSMMA